MTLSDRQHDAFDNPAKALCRDGNLRVLREAAYRRHGRLVTMSEREIQIYNSPNTRCCRE
jgi:hypothetical protein